MIARKTLIGLLSLFLTLSFVHCSKKKGPSDASDAAISSSADEDASVEEVAPSDDSSMSDSTAILANLPTLYFGYDAATLSSESRSILQEIAEGLKADTSARLSIEGHCDERGSNEYNLALGERRARSVKDYLSRLGVSGSRLSISSFGEERPAVEGSNEAAWAKNRRAVLSLN